MIEVRRGDSPLILGMAHTGTELPGAIAAGLNRRGRALADTDWHVHELYGGLVREVSVVRTSIHRYAIDVNRDPKGVSLYPGRPATALCPLTDFDGRPIYRGGQEPGAAAIQRRWRAYHQPYHAALSRELRRIKGRHGFAVLYDCHSIRGRIPFLFDGRLADFNIGDHDGQSCAADISEKVAAICAAASGFSAVSNGRFKGGWTTRHYGRPAAGVHAIQMELAQSTYMDETAPWTYRPERAGLLRPHLRAILQTLIDWRPS